MKKAKHLSPEERYQISFGLKNHICIKSIARQLGRSPSSIYREIKRNTGPEGYRPKQAQTFASLRCSRANSANVHRVPPELLAKAIEKLEAEQWSPEQIAGRFAQDGTGRISHESIYRHILADKEAGGYLYLHLRRHRRRYTHRTGSSSSRGYIKNRRDIDERPTSVLSRKQIGNWEADTVVGKQVKGKVLVTLVERKSRFALVAPVSEKSAEAVSSAIESLLRPFVGLVKTITYDNGKEFAAHERIDQVLGSTAYFAHPYHSWERGTNENTNGLLRQYFPKGSSMNNKTPEFVLAVQNRLNNRPRKILGFRTPYEVFMTAYKRKLASTNRLALKST